MSRTRFKSRISSRSASAPFWRNRRFRQVQGRGWLKIGLLAGGLSMVAALGGVAWIGVAAMGRHGPAPTPAVVAAKPVPVRLAPKPGPAELQTALEEIADAYGEPVGIAVADVSAGWAAAVRGHEYFPQQSVSKTWVAVTVLDAIDRGKISLDSPVTMTAADRSVFNQPLARNLPPEGFTTTVGNLMRHALSFSDNSANDTLIRVVGLDAVRETLRQKGLTGIRMGADERNLQAMIAGLSWHPTFGEGRNFEQARAKLDKEVRRNAAKAYLTDPADGATPIAIVQALTALKRGEILSPSSEEHLLRLMAASRTGRERLRGGLPAGWMIAHKTGTGPDLEGSSIGINDVAVLTAPDGRSYAVAVLIPRTTKPVRERLAMMQAVSRAVVRTWAENSKTEVASLPRRG